MNNEILNIHEAFKHSRQFPDRDASLHQIQCTQEGGRIGPWLVVGQKSLVPAPSKPYTP